MKRILLTLAVVLAACSDTSSPGSGPTTTPDASAASDTAAADGVAPSCEFASRFTASACNPLCDPTGCGAGTICTTDATGGLACMEPGTQPLRKGCNEVSTCAAGACVKIANGSPKCRPFCTKNIECEEGEVCGSETTLPSGDKAKFCVPKPPKCDLFAQDCEKPEEACTLEQNGTLCVKPGEEILGAKCAAVDDCKKELVCVSDKCHQPCSLKSGGGDPKCKDICDYGFGTLEDNVLGVCTLYEKDECQLLGGTCDGGKSCIFDGTHTKCATAGTTEVGAACTSAEDCVATATCFAEKCRSLCNPKDATHAECENPLSPCPALVGTNAGYCDE